jgi:site-specific recombinase XerD
LAISCFLTKQQIRAFQLIINELRFIRCVSLVTVSAVITHMARHTYGTYLINKGVPVAVIQRAMGHAKITQTLGYAKLSAKTVRNEILEIGQNNRFVS